MEENPWKKRFMLNNECFISLSATYRSYACSIRDTHRIVS